MKTAFTFKKWYWGDEYDKQPPQWWNNFIRNKPMSHAFKELQSIAKIREKANGNIRVVFNSPKELTLFILRWSN